MNEEAGERCEGEDIAGATCEQLGFDLGDVTCGADCDYDTSACHVLPGTPGLQLTFSQVKRFDFSWPAVAEADYYQLLESRSPGAPFEQVGEDILGESVSIEVPLHDRFEASYSLKACNTGGCTDSSAVDVTNSLTNAVGYFKASNTGPFDAFGNRVALSGDGSTLAVGAYLEDSNATGINGNQADDSFIQAGAVYVFVRDGVGSWSQQAYIKASNTDPADQFGTALAISETGDTIAVGTYTEDSDATGVNGDQADNSASNSGAAYVFVRDEASSWSQQAYIKASNARSDDYFGWSVALSGDGSTLAVGARSEDSSATGINGDQLDDSATNSGAVYLFTRNGMGSWSQHLYIKASNTGTEDYFGESLALSRDGNTLAVGSYHEASSAVGIDGNEADDSSQGSGAAYIFTHSGMGTWIQQAYIKASNTGPGDQFGYSVALNADGDTLAVGARSEDSGTTGIDGDQSDDSSVQSGAAYVFARDGLDVWSQQAYVKSSNTDSDDNFGESVALSDDGDILVAGALWEDSSAVGINGDTTDDSASASGAVFVFQRDMITWSQRSYVKAPNTDPNDRFGEIVALSGDGNTLAIGSSFEEGNATGIGGDQTDNSLSVSGAVFLY